MFENRERNANYEIYMCELTPDYIPIIETRCDYALNKYEYEIEKAEMELHKKGEFTIFDFDFGSDDYGTN